jgi:hypothetical protein
MNCWPLLRGIVGLLRAIGRHVLEGAIALGLSYFPDVPAAAEPGSTEAADQSTDHTPSATLSAAEQRTWLALTQQLRRQRH